MRPRMIESVGRRNERTEKKKKHQNPKKVHKQARQMAAQNFCRMCNPNLPLPIFSHYKLFVRVCLFLASVCSSHVLCIGSVGTVSVANTQHVCACEGYTNSTNWFSWIDNKMENSKNKKEPYISIILLWYKFHENAKRQQQQNEEKRREENRCTAIQAYTNSNTHETTQSHILNWVSFLSYSLLCNADLLCFARLVDWEYHWRHFNGNITLTITIIMTIKYTCVQQ